MNASGAVETFGKGLFELGKVMIRREEDDIAFMRQQALQELGIQADKDLQAARHTQAKELQEANIEANATADARNIAADMGRDQANQTFQLQRDKQNQAFDMGRDATQRQFTLEMAKLNTLEEARQRTEYTITSINKSIEDMELAKLKAQEDPTAQVDVSGYDDRIKSLYRQIDTVREVGIATERRLSGAKPIDKSGIRKFDSVPERKKGAATVAAPSTPSGPPPGAYTGKQPTPGPQSRASPPLKPMDTSSIPGRIEGKDHRPEDLFGGPPRQARQIDPAAAQFTQQVNNLRNFGKTDEEIKKLLGGRFSPNLFDTYLSK